MIKLRVENLAQTTFRLSPVRYVEKGFLLRIKVFIAEDFITHLLKTIAVCKGTQTKLRKNCIKNGKE